MSLSHEKQNLRDVIITAVRHGHCKVVEEAVKRSNKFEKEYKYTRFPPSPGDLLDFCNVLHYSPLIYACESDNLEMVNVLLESNASVAFTNQDGLTALHVACVKGNPSIVKALLQASAKQGKFSKRKRLPSDLHIALNARTNKDGWCPLFYAVKEGHVELVSCLQEEELASIQQHHIFTIPLCIQVTSKKKRNVLHIAARKQRLDCLKELHQYIPPVSPDADSLYLAVDKGAWNVLHHACAGGSVEVLKWLIETFPGLDTDDFLNAKTMPGYTPLLIACRHQKTDIVRYFAGIDGVDFSACCENSRTNEDGQRGTTGLHLAAIHDSPEIAHLLIKKGCPVHTQNEKGETALHLAVRKASLDVADMLRKTPGGESLEQITNKDGDTPSDIQPEEVIPAEIKKRGEGAVNLYREALRTGKKKIPRCNLLVLGEERVGKTSLIRLLTGKHFIPDLKPTRGIDNRVVDTVDTTAISTVKWEEVKQDDQTRENDDLLVTGVVEVMGPLEPLNQHKQGEKEAVKAVSPEELLKKIDQIFSEMERVQKPIYSPAHAAPRLHPDVPIQQGVPEVPRETYTHPQTTPPTTAGVPKEDIPETYSSEPQPDVAIEPPLESHEPTMHKADTIQSQESSRQVDRILSRRHAQLIDQKLKSTSQGKKEPTLHLKTYDFAGQKYYRPMHHCFITRRSIYIVVFNLQKLLASSDDKERSESLNQIQYWLNSIHAHIYTEDDKTRQIFLVGTHRSPKNREQGKPITEDELQNIHKMLRSTYCCKHSRFTNHLRFPGHNNRIFAAIENSYDDHDDPDERKTSGLESLQHALQEASKDLKFLSNEYPLTWLGFETQLMQMREERQQGKASQVVELPRVLYRAQRCGILDQKQIDLALQFFHDTGTIILLRELPTLFLGESEKEQLANLVLLDPKWLITLMKIVMELKDGDPRFSGEDLVDLKETGIASATLLRDSWKDYLDTDVSFEKLCLMLQAYCLIFPIRDVAGSPNQLQSDDHEALPRFAQEADTTKFLVPSMLPDVKLEDFSCYNYTFYFDFQGFLPAEVFHRFVCLMLARKSPEDPQLSANCCQFYEVEGSDWQLEKVETGHVLQVSVVPSEAEEKPPHYYISMIHQEFLKKICNESDLKGLVYCGGPKVACQRSQCQWSGILAYVQYPNDSSKVKCQKCKKEYKECDIDKILEEQREKRMSEVDYGASPAVCSRLLSYYGKKPNMVNLQSFKTKSGKKIKVSGQIGTKYKDFGLQLLNDESGQIVTGIIQEKHENAEEINYEILRQWVNGKGKPHSWETLIEVLEDCELGTLAQEIKNGLTTST